MTLKTLTKIINNAVHKYITTNKDCVSDAQEEVLIITMELSVQMTNLISDQLADPIDFKNLVAEDFQAALFEKR